MKTKFNRMPACGNGLIWLICLFAIFMSVMSARAGETYGVDNTAADPHYAAWIQGLDNQLSDPYFRAVDGTFTTNDNGSARFKARVLSRQTGEGFDADVTFTGRTSTAPDGSPKPSWAYTIDASDWVYYTGMQGTMTGIAGGRYEGVVLTLTRRGPAFQVGTGANLNDQNLMGGATWYDFTATEAEGSCPVNNKGHGDFNFRMKECPQPKDYCVVDTKTSCGNGAPYTMWFANSVDKGSSQQRFRVSGGRFVEGNDDRAVFTAQLRDGNDDGFSLVGNYGGRTGVIPEGSPKESSCYEIEPDSWVFYRTFEGTLTGLPGTRYEGAVLHLTRRGPTYQMGVGANVQREVFGASNWFEIDVVQQPSSGKADLCDTHGDFNFELVECDTRLGDFVWFDKNGNGIQEDGEPGLSGVEVNLLKGGAPAGTTVTNDQGAYIFEDLAPGSYSIQVTLPAGFSVSPKNAADDDIDSDIDDAGLSDPVVLAAGDNNLDLDAGLICGPPTINVPVDVELECPLTSTDPIDTGVATAGSPCSLDVVVTYTDRRVNGDCPGSFVLFRTWTATDACERVVSGEQKITVEDNQGPVLSVPADYSVSADASCLYMLPELTVSAQDNCEGDVTITQNPLAGTVFDGPGAFVVTLTATDACGNASSKEVVITVSCNFASLGDRVWLDTNGNGIQDDDEVGLPGLTVNLYASNEACDVGELLATTTTIADGIYRFDDLDSLVSYVVQVELSTELAEQYEFTSFDKGDNDAADSDFGPSGFSWCVALADGEHNPTIDAGLKPRDDGLFCYHFDRLVDGKKLFEVDFAYDEERELFAWTAVVHKDTPFVDREGDAHTGADLKAFQLTMSHGPMPRKQEYAVVQFDATSAEPLVSVYAYNDKNQVIHNTQDTGWIMEASATDLGDVWVYRLIADATQINDYKGGLWQGLSFNEQIGIWFFGWVDFVPTYEADGRLKGYIQTGYIGQDKKNDVSEECPDPSLGDRVWADTNRNGLQDGGEAGIPDVRVHLLNEAGDVVDSMDTDGQGNYLFEGLTSLVNYQVRFETPAGFVPSPQNAGDDDEIDSDADRATGTTQAVLLFPGEQDLSLDAGYAPCSLVVTATGGTITCLETETQLKATASEAGVHFLWEGPGGFVSEDQNPVVSALGTYKVTVSSDDECSDSAYVDVSEDKTVPDDLLVSVDGPLTCLRDVAVVSASISDATAIFEWFGPSGFNAQGASTNVSIPGTYRVVVTLSNGCTTAGRVDVLEDRDAPTVNVSNDGPLTCINDSVTLRSGAPVTGRVYQWTGPNGFRSSEANPSVQLPGLYELTVTAASGCTAKSSTEVGEDRELPTVVASVQGELSCTVLEVQLSAVSQETGVAYAWTGPNGYQSNLANPVVTVAGTYDVVATGANGCTANDSVSIRESDCASIGDFVWKDLNANGTQDAGEPGVPGVDVKLWTVVNGNLGEVVADTVTNGSGAYAFNGVDPALLYSVQFVIPVEQRAGCAFTTPGQGGDQARDSNADQSSGLTPVIQLAPGENNSTIDAGLILLDADINIEKTVYVGHDNGASCPGVELVTVGSGAPITYCFVVTNTGSTYLSNIEVNDDLLTYSETIAGPLAPGASVTLHSETLAVGDVLNTVTTKGNPTDEQGNDLPGVEDPTDEDTAEVKVVVPAIDIQKTVYLGHNAGAACPGVERVEEVRNTPITYCFVVTNIGVTHLNQLALADAQLGITDAQMVVRSGSLVAPLAPGATVELYFETILDGDLVNTASVIGHPVTESGEDIPGTEDVSDQDDAEVGMNPFVNSLLTGTVYFDQDDNGIFDPDSIEFGFTNIVLTLIRDGQPILQSQTDEVGGYSFPNLAAGTYVVKVDVPGVEAVEEQLHLGRHFAETNSTVAPYVLAGDDIVTGVDFGFLVRGTIRGYVFHDLNNNGILDENNVDPTIGINGISIRLFRIVDGQKVLYETYVSNVRSGAENLGYFEFNELPLGDYLWEVGPAEVNAKFATLNIETEGFRETTALSHQATLKFGALEDEGDFGFRVSPSYVSLKSFEAAAVQGGVNLRWETAAELDNLGFKVYRSTSEDGPKVAVNEQLVLGQGTGTGQVYELIDANVPAGEYLYWLEDIEYDFTRTMHDPVPVVVSGTEPDLAAEDEASPEAPGAVAAKRGKIPLGGTGLYRVEHKILEAAGFADYERLTVSIDGFEVAVFVAADEFVLFYVPEGAKMAELSLSDKPFRMDAVDAGVPTDD